MKKPNKYFFFLVISIIMGISFSSTEEFGYGKTETNPINYSLIPNINNSDYLDGYDSSAFVPYSGATQNLDLGDNNLSCNGITISAPAPFNYPTISADDWLLFNSEVVFKDSVDFDSYINFNGEATFYGSPYFSNVTIATLSVEDNIYSGSIYSEDIRIDGEGTEYALRIYQGDYKKGMILYGYNDTNTSYWRTEVNNYSATVMYTSGGLYTNGFSLTDDSKGRIGSNSEYWYVYDNLTAEYQFWTTNFDGAGGNHKLMYVDDATYNITYDAQVKILGTLDANDIYYNTLTAKSPIFMCSEGEEWCYVMLPEEDEILRIRKDKDWNILEVDYNNESMSYGSFKSAQKGSDKERISQKVNSKIIKLQNKANCINRGYLWDEVCYQIVKEEVNSLTAISRIEKADNFIKIDYKTTYENSVELTQKDDYELIDSTCLKLDQDLRVVNYACKKRVLTGQKSLVYRFKEGCFWNETSYFCSEYINKPIDEIYLNPNCEYEKDKYYCFNKREVRL